MRVFGFGARAVPGRSPAANKRERNMAKLTDEQRRARAVARRRTEALRAEEDAQRGVERTACWERDGTRLSYEEFIAGVACR